MNRAQKREVVATLLRAGRKDLARVVAIEGGYEARWASMVAETMQRAAQYIKSRDEKKTWLEVRAALKLQKQLIAMLDGGTAEPKEVALLEKTIQLLSRRL